MSMTENLHTFESEVGFYCRRFPETFTRARNATLWNAEGREFIDFFAGAGALNYGHNDQPMKEVLIQHLDEDRIVHALDLRTPSKDLFLSKFNEIILKPRNFSYKVQFAGPTGTNSVEAALKLARKIKKRSGVVAFTNAFHGMSMGSLAASARSEKRKSAGVDLHDIVRMPYDGFLGEEVDTINVIEPMLTRLGCGNDLPAAFILETVQAEGGLNVASNVWLERLGEFAFRNDILLVIDDIQAGCGRTGDFFSFDRANITPDIVCLSKSISGFGLPMSLVLIRPDLDIWEPGEHSGTFRANSLALATATTALDRWKPEAGFRDNILRKSEIVRDALEQVASVPLLYPPEVRGIGLLQGLRWRDDRVGQLVSERLFRHGVIAEVCGPDNGTLKVMPPLTIPDDLLREGLRRLMLAVSEVTEELQRMSDTETAGRTAAE